MEPQVLHHLACSSLPAPSLSPLLYPSTLSLWATSSLADVFPPQGLGAQQASLPFSSWRLVHTPAGAHSRCCTLLLGPTHLQVGCVLSWHPPAAPGRESALLVGPHPRPRPGPNPPHPRTGPGTGQPAEGPLACPPHHHQRPWQSGQAIPLNSNPDLLPPCPVRAALGVPEHLTGSHRPRAAHQRLTKEANHA